MRRLQASYEVPAGLCNLERAGVRKQLVRGERGKRCLSDSKPLVLQQGGVAQLLQQQQMQQLCASLLHGRPFLQQGFIIPVEGFSSNAPTGSRAAWLH